MVRTVAAAACLTAGITLGIIQATDVPYVSYVNTSTPCQWTVAWDPTLGDAVPEALDQIEGYTGVGWATSADPMVRIEVVASMPQLGVAQTRYVPQTGEWLGGTITIRADVIHSRYLIRVLVHELAHLLNMHHSSDPTSLFYPTVNRLSVLQVEDLQLLEQLGAAATSACESR